jgi:hypothetical protein
MPTCLADIFDTRTAAEKRRDDNLLKYRWDIDDPPEATEPCGAAAAATGTTCSDGANADPDVEPKGPAALAAESPFSPFTGLF